MLVVSIILRLICVILDAIMAITCFRAGETKNAICWTILSVCFLGLIILQVYRKIRGIELFETNEDTTEEE